MTRPPRLLVVSPIASHPPDQGNAARLVAFGQEMAARGILCEFLYHTLEGLQDAQREAMAAFWPVLHLHHAPPLPEPRFPGAWGLDDWCPEGLVERVAVLQRRRRYDAVVVNYVWMSRALEGAGEALRILDTHDVFGDRHHAARAEGLDPSWFFTTPEEEARGLARAELVLAIQAEEAAVLRARGARAVLTLGHAPPPPFLAEAGAPPAPRASFGYLGSANPWNTGSVRALDAALAEAPELDWLLAGSILRRRDLRLRSRPLLLDPLPEAAAFYRAVGCVVNPMTGGTGLKIKTVEALMHGRPVLGTRDAFAGLPAEHPGHRAADVPALVALMREHAASAAFRAELARASRLLALRYAAEVAVQHDALAALVAGRARGAAPP
ncbi:glycosyltransferase family protein [Crenalkalicoccus roseus]|uniref:glycosyltransferase n=1 Tax=Crenalkalicoccus roseus TaxID=1485588 RepID=UPI0010806113|nr:glycosyltransferase [Crenalkalicoccus roseus]